MILEMAIRATPTLRERITDRILSCVPLPQTPKSDRSQPTDSD
ncbi:hypothetical protein [Lyngbya sp. PCC 8106]|nr:hypothetical protein [Lyngbya sp. PCC 8106]